MEHAREAYEALGDDLELLIFRALDHDMPLSITLVNGKVYVGYVTRSLTPDVERTYLRISPIVSGYRREDTQEVSFTTDYARVKSEAKDHSSDLYGLLNEDFDIVLPLARIVSVSLFDFVAYEAFEEERAHT